MVFEDVRMSEEVKRYHCCIWFADDLNFVAIAFLLNVYVLLSERQKGSQVHFALDVAICFHLDAVHVMLKPLLKKGCIFVLRRILNEP